MDQLSRSFNSFQRYNMNKLNTNSTQKNSVNSSFSTVRNDCLITHDTATKHIQNKRFSYQETKNHIQTSQKQNVRMNFTQPNTMQCLNHHNKPAQYAVLAHSDDPMYMCERCAVLVASKGFEISKMQDQMKVQIIPTADFQREVNQCLSGVKMSKMQTMDNLKIYSCKLDKKQLYLQEYFGQLHQYLEKEKNSMLKDILQFKKHIQQLREDSSQFYFNLLDNIKQIGNQSYNLTLDRYSQLSQSLKNIKKLKFQICYDQLKYSIHLPEVHQVGQQLSLLLKPNSDGKLHSAERQLKLKCEVENSSIRSLQLSFEQQNNFTLNNHQCVGLGDGKSSTNLLTSECYD